MTLVMRTAKGAVSFECSDEDAEIVVKIEPTDTEEVMLRKLKRVITLVEGEQAELPRGHVLDELREPADWRDALAKQRVVGRVSEAPPTNGWAAYAEPKVPERLQGEVELMQPGEND